MGILRYSASSGYMTMVVLGENATGVIDYEG